MSDSLQGIITKITHYKAPFFIGSIRSGTKEICVLGNVDSPPSKGTEVELIGKYKEHPKYGEQFSFWTCIEKLPDISDKKGIIRILTDKCKGIGPKKAEKLYNILGEKTLEFISEDPELLVNHLRLKRENAEHNSLLIKNLIINDEVRVPLLAWGLSPSSIDRINTFFGENALNIIQNDPYQLVCIKGIGFSTLDSILLERKLASPNSPQRGMAICYHILKEAINLNGHTYITIADIMTSLKGLALIAPISEVAILQGIKYGVDNSILIESSSLSYTLPEVCTAERTIALKINEILSKPLNPKIHIDTSEWLQEATPNALQLEAVESVGTNKISIITGGPGTGKTFVLKGIIKSLPKGVKKALMAPTGKAAKRMAESLEGTNAPLPTTIHRFLRQKPEDMEHDLIKSNYIDNYKPSAPRLKPSEIPDIVIIDELSMVDIFLFSQLLTYTGTHPHFILIGDIDQLPSIGPGLVLSDLISSNLIKTTKFLKNERQIEGSTILYNAYQVITGQPISIEQEKDWLVSTSDISSDLVKPIFELVDELIAKGYDPIKDIQVLSPQNRGVLGVHSLNSLFRQKLNPKDRSKPELLDKEGNSLFRVGDKVVSTKNVKLPSPTGDDVFIVNGDTGIITNIEITRNMHGGISKCSITVDFDSYTALYINDLDKKTENPLDYLTQAWAMTVHKSQGSEYKIIIISLSNEVYSELLNRPLFYTAITRGKELVAIYGSNRSISKAISNNKVIKRQTNLPSFLESYSNE